MSREIKPTPEFRREDVRVAPSSGRTRREIAEDPGDRFLDVGVGRDRDEELPGEPEGDLRAELKGVMPIWRAKTLVLGDVRRAGVGQHLGPVAVWFRSFESDIRHQGD